MNNLVNILFWILWVVALLISLIESFANPDFVIGRSDVRIIFLIFGAGIFAVLLLFIKLTKKEIARLKTDKIFYILSISLAALFLILKFINRFVSSDFVLNKLHVQPDSFMLPISISLLPVAVILVPRINFKKLFRIKTLLFILLFFLITRNIFEIYKAKWQDYQFIITHPLASHDEKMKRVIGSLSYDYAQFVTKYTPPDTTLLIPPQAFPWPSSGNVGYFRYFTYPRTLISGDEFVSPSTEALSKIDFVLLNWGETIRVEGGHTHDWPKFDVEAEKIIFMNEDGTYGGEIKGSYRYSDYKNKRVWGIIVIKH